MKVATLLCGLILAATPLLAQGSYPPESLYNLSAELIDQSGRQHGIDVHRGHPVLVTMFYGTCSKTCPLLIDTLRTLERAVEPERRSALRVLLISIDPERDTVEVLQAIAGQRGIDTSRWTLARTDPATIRRIAAMLGTQYRRLPDGTYNHASVISLLNAQGKLVHQSVVLGRPDEDLLRALREAR